MFWRVWQSRLSYFISTWYLKTLVSLGTTFLVRSADVQRHFWPSVRKSWLRKLLVGMALLLVTFNWSLLFLESVTVKRTIMQMRRRRASWWRRERSWRRRGNISCRRRWSWNGGNETKVEMQKRAASLAFVSCSLCVYVQEVHWHALFICWSL